MTTQEKAISNDMDELVDAVHALMAATADAAGDKVVEARKRLANALQSGKGVFGRAREKAIEGAKVANEALHEHPYKAVAIGVGVGVLSGLLFARRCSCKCP